MDSSGHIVGSVAVRIILLKTVVGYEKPVYEDYLDSLIHHKDKSKRINAWFCYKIFGDYDLCFVIVRENLDHDMLGSGTINGITYSTELLCYKWGADDLEEMDRRFSKMPIIGINIIKLEPALLIGKGPNEIEQAFYSQISDDIKDVFCFGTFGWNEFILLYPIDSYDKVYSQLICKAQDFAGNISDSGDYSSLFIKSFSLIGVNYRVITSLNMAAELNKLDNHDKKIYPSVFVACRPSDMQMLWTSLIGIFDGKGIKLKNEEKLFILGMYDFVIEIVKFKWGDFVKALLDFRKENSNSIFKTNVQLCGVSGFPEDTKVSKIFSPDTININSSDVKTLKRLDQPLDETIVSTVYTFNQYLRNELLFDSVEDMADYVVKLKREAFNSLDVGDNNKEISLKYLENMPELIRIGCYQRLAGLFLQEGSEDFSSYKGGKQRLLKALKMFCKDIIDNVFSVCGIDGKWEGFVKIGRQNNYAHFYDTLSIPIDTAFCVEKYFGLFHEIGHLILLHQGDENKFIDLSDIDKRYTSFLEEVFCDLFDFQCGFLGKHELYFKTIMPYLGGVVKKQCLEQDIKRYSVRLLSVMAYSLIIKGRGCDIDTEAVKLLSDFFEVIGNYENDSLKQDILFKFSETLKSLLNNFFEGKFSVFFEKKLEVGFYRKRGAIYNSIEYKAQFSDILAGKTVTNLQHPHLVVLSMLENKDNLSFKAETAAIRSFINCYYERGMDKTSEFYYDEEQVRTVTCDVVNVLTTNKSLEDIKKQISNIHVPEQILRADYSSYVEVVEKEISHSVPFNLIKDIELPLLVSLTASALGNAVTSEFIFRIVDTLIKYIQHIPR
ncbi:MAG: hypothetical protein HQK94_16040 [Nitrospirae bacterium]|nr:hypothetical protein [Nitrospirota bacterium]MBF0536275.1 hypothetical protein [Nitrospirota bacterium]